MPSWRRVGLVGPHPVRLARTAAFVARRQAQRRRLRTRYDVLAAATDPIGPLVLPELALDRVERLPAPLQQPARAVCAEAEDVLAHRVDFLGSGLVDLGPVIDWHTDFKSGYRWEPSFYQDLEVTRLDDASDAKVPWELSRGHQLLTLARAARMTGEQRFADGLADQLSSWLEANPPGRGINWVTPMELGFRAVNWMWALGTLDARVTPVPPELLEAVSRSLHWHGRHIAAELEGTPYLRSNHFLGDILGMLAIGGAFPEDPAARRWQRWAHRAFEREIVRQVHPDGVGFEASLSYHGLALEMFLVARRLADVAGRPFSARYNDRLRRMVDVIRSARHPDGRIPLFGDQDSGRVLPGSFARPPTHDHLAWLGAALLGTGRPLSGLPDPEVAWNLGLGAYVRLEEAAPAAPPPTSFPVGGIYVLDGAGTHVVVRCGGVGQHGSGGHAHNDALSYELSRGRPLVVDSGTYVYTADVAARNAMRASRAHNVTLVDGEEINALDPRRVFELREQARPRVEAWRENDAEVVLLASHTGYARLDPPAELRRTFTLSRRTGGLTVHDRVAGAGERRLETFVHAPAGSSVTRVGPSSFAVARPGARAVVTFTSPGLETEVSEGCVSDRYGVRERAPVLVARCSATLPAELGYSVLPD